MTTPSRPIIQFISTENAVTSSFKWTQPKNSSYEEFQNVALKYFKFHYSNGNPGNYEVVETFLYQHSTSPFTFLKLRTDTKSYDIQVYSKTNVIDKQRKLSITSEHCDKKVIKTSIAFDNPLHISFSDSKTSVIFLPKDSVSRVYSHCMANNSHDQMLKAFFNSDYSSISTYVGGCENHYRVTKTGEEGVIRQEIPPPVKNQIWSIK